MDFDLVVKGGTLIDGSGAPRRQADVGIAAGRIQAVGDLSVGKAELLDARDRVVAPGFIDAHTHLDAQLFWDPLGSSSCYQGVTTAIFGNCGFTLAPIDPAYSDLLLEHFEAAEALPLESLKAGVEISWRSFPEYMKVLENLPKGINCASYVGHSALRIDAMGERAFEPESRSEDLEAMTAGLKAALAAGAIGFSTSRVSHHRLRDGRLIASGHAPWSEVQALVRTMAREGGGVFELAREKIDPGNLTGYDFPDRLGALAVETGLPVSLGVFHAIDEPGAADAFVAMVEKARKAGGDMVGQVHTNTMYAYYNFLARPPFDHLPAWAELRNLMPDDLRAQLSNSDCRQRLCQALDEAPRDAGPGPDDMELLRKFLGSNPSLTALAKQRGQHPGEVALDEALKSDLQAFFRVPFANVDETKTAALLRHSDMVPTFSDAGAHISEVADTCISSVLLGHWVREKELFSLEEAVHLITAKIAALWGLHDRGLVRPGYAADLVIFDPDEIGPEMPQVRRDFPLGMARIEQACAGIDCTIVNGQPFIRRGQATGALAGQLLRRQA